MKKSIDNPTLNPMDVASENELTSRLINCIVKSHSIEDQIKEEDSTIASCEYRKEKLKSELQAVIETKNLLEAKITQKSSMVRSPN
jgi:hypothetical protein